MLFLCILKQYVTRVRIQCRQRWRWFLRLGEGPAAARMGTHVDGREVRERTKWQLKSAPRLPPSVDHRSRAHRLRIRGRYYYILTRAQYEPLVEYRAASVGINQEWGWGLQACFMRPSENIIFHTISLVCLSIRNTSDR